jgi:hypothetical protein
MQRNGKVMYKDRVWYIFNSNVYLVFLPYFKLGFFFKEILDLTHMYVYEILIKPKKTLLTFVNGYISFEVIKRNHGRFTKNRGYWRFDVLPLSVWRNISPFC